MPISMAASSRKRTYSQRAKTLEIDRKDEAEEEEGRLRLLLKQSSSFQTETALSLLETCLEIPEDEVIENLLQSLQLLLACLSEDWEKVLELIKRIWSKYNANSVICSVLVNMLIQFVPDVPPLSLQQLHFIMSMFENDSKEVQSLILRLWSLIGDSFTNELKTRCIEKAVNVIYDSCYMLRMECLNLIGSLNHDTVSQESLLSLVAEFCNDTDPRVRRASIRSLLLLLQKGVPVELSVYRKSCDLLQDDDDSVRKNALQLVYCLGVKLQESGIMVPLIQDPNIMLPIEDDCFIKTCDMVTDISVAVRSLATSLLGQFKSVSEKFLLQTLDKKLMSHLKVVKSQHQRARDVASGSRDWDTGQRWGGGAPRLDLDPTEVTLLRSGSCGAFVHSLEDEFLEVRSVAVVSMGHLCMISSMFGSLSLDYLVDMFNDEIENVRLLAINCLRKVSTTIHFREDQLETVLGILQESSQEIREALHDLLASCHITTTSGLRITVHSLLDNLKKYPTDCRSIWSCMKHLGNRHAHLVCSLVPQLLSSHPYFLTKEPDINDAAYVSILILVFNATGLSPTMVSLFPLHIFHHYNYLHHTLPLLIPLVKVLTASQRTKLPEIKTSSPGMFLEQILSRVKKPMLESRDQNVAMVTLKQCIADLNQFSKVEPSLSGCVQFSSQLLQCRLLLIKIQRAVFCAVMATAGPNETATDIRELLLLSYRLQWTYTGHDSKLLMTLHLLRVIGHCALLAFTIKQDWPIDHRDKFEQLRSGLCLRVENLTKLCEGNSLSLPVLIQPLTTRLVHTDANQLLPLLQSAVHDCVLNHLDSTQLIKIRQCWADIIDPVRSDDTVHKFLSSLALALPMKAVINNLMDVSSLAAKVKLPDGRSIVSIPKETELRLLDNNDILKLNMKIILSHGNWTDSSSLLLQLIKYYKPDTPNDLKCLEILNKLCRKGGVARVSAVDCASDNIGEVVISESVRVWTHPQESLTKAFNVFGPI